MAVSLPLLALWCLSPSSKTFRCSREMLESIQWFTLEHSLTKDRLQRYIDVVFMFLSPRRCIDDKIAFDSNRTLTQQRSDNYIVYDRFHFIHSRSRRMQIENWTYLFLTFQYSEVLFTRFFHLSFSLFLSFSLTLSLPFASLKIFKFIATFKSMIIFAIFDVIAAIRWKTDMLGSFECYSIIRIQSGFSYLPRWRYQFDDIFWISLSVDDCAAPLNEKRQRISIVWAANERAPENCRCSGNLLSHPINDNWETSKKNV